MRLLGTVLGTPLGEQERSRIYANLVGDLNDSQAFMQVLSGMQHNTDKAGALLAAQGIFAVACTFAIDHGWPRPLALTAILLLLIGALLAMSILRSTAAPFSDGESRRTARIAFDLLAARMIRFNPALYLTFLSIVLLALAAIAFVL